MPLPRRACRLFGALPRELDRLASGPPAEGRKDAHQAYSELQCVLVHVFMASSMRVASEPILTVILDASNSQRQGPGCRSPPCCRGPQPQGSGEGV